MVSKLEALKGKYTQRENAFYRHAYSYVLYFMMLTLITLFVGVILMLYQIIHRPLPAFHAVNEEGKSMELTSFDEPNLLPATLTTWASKAASFAYTFDFVDYDKELSDARPYFTDAGWADFRAAIKSTITRVVQNQLFVYGVVSGTPVISNQGPLPGRGYVWRIQIPFLVSYLSQNSSSTAKFYVIETIVRVPTSINPQGIGIDQFVMYRR